MSTTDTRALQAIVFDFDGIIADTEPLHLRAFQEVLARRGVTLDRADYYERYLGFDDGGVFRAVASDRRLPWPEDEVGRLASEKAACFLTTAAAEPALFPAVANLLKTWATGVPLAIASGALRHEIDAILSAAGLRSLFRVIVAAGETPKGKPAPDPYRAALAQLGTEPSRSVAVEDSMWGIDSAREAGMKVIAVASSYPADRLTTADAVVASFSDLTFQLFESLARRDR